MRRRTNWKRILALIVLVLLAAAAYLFWPQSVDLPHLATAGDGHDVRILRDSWGVPHIFGVTDTDVAYGLAYAHAEDDFLTIQQSLLAARGDLAAVYGADPAPAARSPHFADQSPLFVRRELKPVWMEEADIRANLEKEYRPGEEMGP
jgi:acyl-homoserine lactone acylase PvdQ